MFSILFPAQKLLSEQASPTHKHPHFHPLQHLYSSANQTRTRPTPMYVHQQNQTLLVQAHISIYTQLQNSKTAQLLNCTPTLTKLHHSHNYTQHSHSYLYLYPSTTFSRNLLITCIQSTSGITLISKKQKLIQPHPQMHPQMHPSHHPGPHPHPYLHPPIAHPNYQAKTNTPNTSSM